MGKRMSDSELSDMLSDEGYLFLREELRNKRRYILLIHNICGHEYFVSLANFKKGRRCPNCQPQRIWKDFEVEQVLTDNQYSSEDIFVSGRVDFKIKHDICGYEFYVKWNNFNSKIKCPKCSNRIKIEINYVREYMLENDHELISKKYISAHKKLKMKHLSCGNIFSMAWTNFKGGQRCPKCSAKRAWENHKKTIISKSGSFGDNYPELASEWSKKNESSPFENTNSSVIVQLWVCKKHQIEYSSTIRDRVYSNRGCPECSKENRMDNYMKTIISKRGSLLENYPEISSEWSYKNEKSPQEYSSKSAEIVYWICGKGEHEDYLMRIYSRTSAGNSCPKCRKYIGEVLVEEFLNSNGVMAEREKTFEDCKNINLLRYDFYLPEYNILIEVQGRQHKEPIEFFGGLDFFELTQKRDKIKKQYAKKNKIKLLEIWYNEFKNIEKILKKELNIQ